MQVMSLHTKLRNLLETGLLSLRSNPDDGHVFQGEGAYYFNHDKVEILPEYLGKAPDGSDTVFSVPHDIAWVPSTKTMLAYSQADTGPFEIMPEEMKKVVSSFKNKNRSSVQ